MERVERLEEEKKTISDDIRDVYAEAKANGFDVKALRTIVRLRKQDADERKEHEAILETYMHALGMLNWNANGERDLTTVRPASSATFPRLAAPRPNDPPDDGKQIYRSAAVRAVNVTVETKTTALPANFSVLMPRCGSSENVIIDRRGRLLQERPEIAVVRARRERGAS